MTILRSIELPGWTGLKISGRVDAFNDRQLIQTLEQTVEKSSRVAIDLSEADFLSLQVLKYFADTSRDLGRKGGELALVRPSHSLRRQIEIFFAPKAFNVYQNQDHLRRGYSVQPRAEFQAVVSEALFI